MTSIRGTILSQCILPIRKLFIMLLLMTAGAGSAAAASPSLSTLQGFAMYPNLLLPSKTFYATTNARTQNRQVFQWFLTNLSGYGGSEAAGSGAAPNPNWPNSPMPATTGIDNYKQEIAMAQAAGYDGFALDEWAQGAGALSANDKANISAIFEAARQMGTGFKLYFAFDEGVGSATAAADYLYLIETYYNHPNYFVRNGLPVVSPYAADYVASTGTASAQWWINQLVKPLHSLATPINLFFVPTQVGGLNFSGGCGAQVAGWYNAGLGIFGISDWQIQTAPLSGGLSCLQEFAASAKAARVSWVGTVSWEYWVQALNAVPGFCTQSCSGGTYFEHGGGTGLAASWTSMINTEAPAWVVQLTANDYQESYGETVDDYVNYQDTPGNGIAQYTPPKWYKSQAGMAKLSQYYMQWYRSGVQPTLTANAIFYDYQTVASTYTAPTTNLFTATIGDGKGGTGDLLTVSAVQQGAIVPGEIVTYNGGKSTATIASQVSGTANGAGVYAISATDKALSQAMSTHYYTTKPTFVGNGQTPNSLYITVAALAGNTSFAATGGSAAYETATVDGTTVNLPATLTAGLHQIILTKYQLGAQTFKLSLNGAVVAQATGPSILATSPIYDARVVTGSSM